MKRGSLAVLIAVLAAFAAQAQPDQKPATEAAVAAVGADKAPKAKGKKPAKAVVKDYKPLASEYGKAAKCPVTGEEFQVTEQTAAVKYKGKTYYFCCPGCAPTFKKTPEKFAR